MKLILLDYELIYNISYNKNDYYSYDVIWNHSMHLITTFKGVETENMNINYIFSGEEEQLTQWNALYFLLPYLHYYISEVQNKLFELNILWKDDASFGSEESKKYLGFIAWGIENEFWDEKYVNLNVFSKNDQSTNILCSKCNNSFSWDIKKVKQLVRCNYIKCDSCKARIKIV